MTMENKEEPEKELVRKGKYIFIGVAILITFLCSLLYCAVVYILYQK